LAPTVIWWGGPSQDRRHRTSRLAGPAGPGWRPRHRRARPVPRPLPHLTRPVIPPAPHPPRSRSRTSPVPLSPPVRRPPRSAPGA